MSKLQEFVGKIVQIIVSYNQTQTSKTYPPEIFTNKSPPELNQFLQEIITEATRGYETRKPLLEYFLFVVNTIKPLTDQKKSLSQQEQQTISDTLPAFLNTLKILLETSHSQYISVKYNKTIVQVPGFIRGALKVYSLCNTGQIISRELAESISQTPFENYFKKLILEHQLPLLEIEHLGKVISDETNEKELMQEQIKNLRNQSELQQTEIANLKNENLGLTTKIKLVLDHAESKEKQPRPEVEENKQLRQELESIKIELNSALQKNEDYADEIRHLKKEMNILHELVTPKVINFYDTLPNQVFFTPVQDNSEQNTTTNHSNNTPRTGYFSNNRTQTE